MEKEVYIQMLLEKFDFIELSDTDREKVLEEMTLEEYTDRRRVITQSEELFQEEALLLVPNPATKYAVKERLAEKGGKSSVIALVFAYRIPAYQVAIAASLLVFLIPYLMRNDEGKIQYVQSDPEVIERVVTDTVIVEREVPQIVEVQKVRYITKEVPVAYQPTVSGSMSIDESFEEQVDGLQLAEERLEDQMNKISQSASDNNELNQFAGMR